MALTIPRLQLYVILLLHANQLHAINSFQTNCTLPTVSVHYVSAPNVRSTLQILWSSLATIIACTYTVVHPDIPNQCNGGAFKQWWHGIRYTLLWTLLTILAPEIWATMAVNDYLTAMDTRDALRWSNRRRRHPIEWTLVHGFYTTMGGYAVLEEDASEAQLGAANSQAKSERRIRSAGRNSRGNGFDKAATLEAKETTSSIRYLWKKSLCALLNDPRYKPTRLPTESDITDRSKSDIFAKSVAILQIIYYCANCLTRAIRHLPVTQLELGTLGFAACSIIASLFLLKKPRSVKTTTFIEIRDPGLYRKIIGEMQKEQHTRSNKASNLHVSFFRHTPFLLSVLTVMFGAIHIAGWDFTFPTAVEKWLWRTCAIVSTVSIPLGYLLEGCCTGQKVFWNIHGEAGGVSFFAFTVYTISRLALIVEMFRCLLFLPPEAFIATWAANIPHI